MNSTDTNVGTVVTVMCNTGYILVGSNRRECLSSQTWSGKSACIGREKYISNRIEIVQYSFVFVLQNCSVFHRYQCVTHDLFIRVMAPKV